MRPGLCLAGVDGISPSSVPGAATMPTRPSPVLLLALLLVACATPQPSAAQPALADAPAHHELHLPPVGPSVLVALDGKVADVALATVPHDGYPLHEPRSSVRAIATASSGA